MTRRRGETDAGKFRINGKGTGLGVCVKRGIVSARGVIPLSDSAPRLFVRGKRKGLSATCAACLGVHAPYRKRAECSNLFGFSFKK